MSARKPPLPLQMRWAAILLGMVLLCWLPIEDTSENFALGMALALSVWGAATYLILPQKPFASPLWNALLAGSLTGGAITPLTLLLMAFKSGLHSHPTPDFTPTQIVSIINRTPIWLLGGFLIGLGSSLWRVYRQT